MTTLLQWANRHQIPQAALADLLQTLGLSAPPDAVTDNRLTSEAGVQQQVRLAVTRAGGRAWRNNCGVTEDSTGRVIRYGLSNDSAQVNRVCKSSDLIGVTPVTCACGRGPYGLFTALECKAPQWKFRQSDDRAVAQFNFIKLVTSLGGIGRFVTDPSQI